MAFWIASLAALALAYLLGATPTGYLAGKLLKRVDIRQLGSGSTGATNVLRTLGKGPALVVLLVDMLKGAAAILLAQWLCARFSPVAPDPIAWTAWVVALAGLFVLVGHARSVWLGFTGGKSAATGLGVLLALAWPVGLLAALVFGAMLALCRIVSLSSMSAAVAAAVLMVGRPLPYRLLVLAGALYVVLRHRANIRRILLGTEPRLGRSKEEPAP